MNLDHDFFRMSKLSENQKKALHQNWNTFFSGIQVETCAQMQTRVKLLWRMQMLTILKLLGGILHSYLQIKMAERARQFKNFK